jgi:hypothetical protein
MSLSLTTKYGFRIRTRQGLLINNLVIQGRDEADAEKKLRQMYRHCEILECSVVQPARKIHPVDVVRTAPAAK